MLEYQRMKTFEVTDCTNQTSSKHLTEKKVGVQDPKNEEKIMKCTQNRRYTSSKYEQPLCKD